MRTSELVHTDGLFLRPSGPGSAGGTLLTVAGKQQKYVWVIMLQITLMVGLFYVLWPKYGLLGGVLATGSSQVVSQILLLAMARLCGPVTFGIAREYAAFLALAGVAGWVSIRSGGFGILPGILCAGATTIAFFVLGGYSLTELQELLRFVLPGSARKPIGSGDALNA